MSQMNQAGSNTDVLKLVIGVLGIGIGATVIGFVSFQTYDAGFVTHGAFATTMLLGGLAVFVGYGRTAATPFVGVVVGGGIWFLFTGVLGAVGVGLALGSVVFGSTALFEEARRTLVNGEPRRDKVN